MPLVPGQRLQAIRSAINRNANHDDGEHYGRRRTTFFCVVVHSMNNPGIFADRLNDGPGRCSAFYAVTMPASEKIDAPPLAAFGFAVDGAPGSSYNTWRANRTPGCHAPGRFLFWRQNVRRAALSHGGRNRGCGPPLRKLL